ncbi:unnamed protein product [Durusdinium trenchii]|uniref:Uncharacterized protein n=1 Tax=Durusdinium trenchii TaxID=1381693 RepID=A0ABP0R4X6_9DINO
MDIYALYAAFMNNTSAARDEPEFNEVVQECQFILGLVMIFATPFVWFFLACCCPNPYGAPNERVRSGELRKSVWTCWEQVGTFLFLFSLAKVSSGAALTFSLTYSLARSLMDLAYSYVYYRKFGLRGVPTKVSPTSAYTDMHSGSIAKALAAFSLQATLYAVVFWAAAEQETVATEKQILFYVLGAFIASVVRLFEPTFITGEFGEVWKPYLMTFPAFRQPNDCYCVRFFLSFIVNGWLSHATLCLIPVILMNSETAIDFVKDSVAVLFIAELDRIKTMLDYHHDIRIDSNSPYCHNPVVYGEIDPGSTLFGKPIAAIMDLVPNPVDSAQHPHGIRGCAQHSHSGLPGTEPVHSHSIQHAHGWVPGSVQIHAVPPLPPPPPPKTPHQVLYILPASPGLGFGM